MPKTTNAAAKTHLGIGASQDDLTTSLATCWVLTRTDGTVFRFTDHDIDLTITSGTFTGTYESSSGFNKTAISADVGLSVGNLEVLGLLDSSGITDDDVVAGRFDFAEVQIFRLNFEAPDDFQIYDFRGHLDRVQLTSKGFFVSELRDLADPLNEGDMLESYGPECLADLGDSRCGIPIEPALRQDSEAVVVGDFRRVATTAGTGSEVYEDRIYAVTTAGTTAGSAPVFDTTVGNTTTDGTAVFTAQEAWSRVITVDTVTSRKEFVVSDLTPLTDPNVDPETGLAGPGTPGRNYFPSDSMNGGAVVWESGSNVDLVMEVKDFVGGASTQTVTLFLDMPFDLQVGDVARVYRGCDKTLATCRDVFDNVEDFRGFGVFTPGSDSLVRFPDAR